jgi:hypothetical protein
LLSQRFIRDRSNDTNLTKLNTTTYDGEFHSPGDEFSVEGLSIIRTLKNRNQQKVLRHIKPPYKHPYVEIKELKEQLDLSEQELVQLKKMNKKMFDRIDELESIKDHNEFELYIKYITSQQTFPETSVPICPKTKHNILEQLKHKLIEERDKFQFKISHQQEIFNFQQSFTEEIDNLQIMLSDK